MGSFIVRPLHAADREWVRRFVIERWGAEIVVTRGIVHRPGELPGFVAEDAGTVVGLLTYRVDEQGLEIVTLDSVRPGEGIGTALLAAARDAAQRAGARRIWLVTTNDNLDALRFYQRRGFVLVAVDRDAIAASRRVKPQVALVGAYGIPLRDEIALELLLP